MMDFWDRLEEQAARAGVNRKSMADAAGIATGNMTMIFTRKSYPSAVPLVRLAKFLRTTAEYLVTGEDAEDPWARTHSAFIADCKELSWDQLATVVHHAHLLADDARKGVKREELPTELEAMSDLSNGGGRVVRKGSYGREGQAGPKSGDEGAGSPASNED